MNIRNSQETRKSFKDFALYRLSTILCLYPKNKKQVVKQKKVDLTKL